MDEFAPTALSSTEVNILNALQSIKDKRGRPIDAKMADFYLWFFKNRCSDAPPEQQLRFYCQAVDLSMDIIVLLYLQMIEDQQVSKASNLWFPAN